ncbi:hypothetical protein I551_5721, partial [Mycobacterium ulcerans str. Harvey]
APPVVGRSWSDRCVDCALIHGWDAGNASHQRLSDRIVIESGTGAVVPAA